MELAQEKCVACRADSPHVTHDEVKELLEQTPGWQVVEVEGVHRLEKMYFFKDWEQAMDFARQVGDAAEEQEHHPQLVVEWGRVRVQWWTHSIRGLHRNDFIMAAKTEQIALDFSAARKV